MLDCIFFVLLAIAFIGAYFAAEKTGSRSSEVWLLLSALLIIAAVVFYGFIQYRVYAAERAIRKAAQASYERTDRDIKRTIEREERLQKQLEARQALDKANAKVARALEVERLGKERANRALAKSNGKTRDELLEEALVAYRKDCSDVNSEHYRNTISISSRDALKEALKVRDAKLQELSDIHLQAKRGIIKRYPHAKAE